MTVLAEDTPVTRDLFPEGNIGSQVYNALMRGGYTTVGKVRATPDGRLMELRAVGVRAVEVIRETCGGAHRPDVMSRRLAIAYATVLADLERQRDKAIEVDDQEREVHMNRAYDLVSVELTGRSPTAF